MDSRRAHRLKALLVERAQHLGLGLQRHVAHFIQKQRSAVGLLQLADFVIERAGQAALAVAEQLAFDEFFGNGGAVHFDERLGGARAGGVNRVRDQFLAGAAFAENQHAAVGGGHQAQLLAQRLHGHALADDAQLGVARFLQPVQFQLQPALLHRVVEHHRDFLDGQRLFQKIEGAQLGGLHGGLDGAVAGDDDHFGPVRERDFLDAGQRFQAIHAGQPDVQQHHFVALRAPALPGIFRRFRRRAQK